MGRFDMNIHFFLAGIFSIIVVSAALDDGVRPSPLVIVAFVAAMAGFAFVLSPAAVAALAAAPVLCARCKKEVALPPRRSPRYSIGDRFVIAWIGFLGLVWLLMLILGPSFVVYKVVYCIGYAEVYGAVIDGGGSPADVDAAYAASGRTDIFEWRGYRCGGYGAVPPRASSGGECVGLGCGADGAAAGAAAAAGGGF